ncbi:MAG: HAMP domain-containing sensor histidine kinase [Acidobacteriota bacterium]|nr:HAMP domain-containing histidine kinase [Blastocatellia bacterium]MDW8413129.1 HAMP domain-containing sensor histidine kinase [Acidobacteriota bacterium]
MSKDIDSKEVQQIAVQSDDKYLQQTLALITTSLCARSAALLTSTGKQQIKTEAAVGVKVAPEITLAYPIDEIGKATRLSKTAGIFAEEVKDSIWIATKSTDNESIFLIINDKSSGEAFDETDLANLTMLVPFAILALEESRRTRDSALRFRELEQRLRELQSLNEILKESNQLKDEVLSICAHDIRSPLTSIISYAQLLLGSQELDIIQRKYVEQINRSSEKINNLVDNLLVRAKYLETSEPIRLESISLSNLLRESLQQVEDRLIAKQLQVEIKETWQGHVRADRFKLSQVLDNLLDNACKFTPEKEKIRITIQSDPTNESAAGIEISNPGEGIAAEDMPKLFVRYFRSSGSQNRKGYGLGLAICRQNIELHGGRIEAESTPGVQTTFRFYIPIGKPSLLILTENENLYNRLANSSNYDLARIYNADELFAFFLKEIPTAIILDSSPNAKLVEALRQLRNEFNSDRLKIICTKDLGLQELDPILFETGTDSELSSSIEELLLC